MTTMNKTTTKRLKNDYKDAKRPQGDRKNTN